MSSLRVSGLALLLACQCQAWNLRALSEWHRPDPFGGIVECDRPGAAWQEAVKLKAARGGYASFQLVATSDADSSAELTIKLPLKADVYREWFHHNTADRHYYPDALIPTTAPYRIRVPDTDNRIQGQKAGAFWVDVWVPASTDAKTYRGEAILRDGGTTLRLPIELTVLESTVPAKDAVLLDSNSYGTSWLEQQYPKTLASLRGSAHGEDELIRLIHAYHRIFYEHRGIYHQLGYGHAGKVGPEFAPELTGTGKDKHVKSWDLFDRHYGPLFDGSAFRDTRRGPSAIPFVYLPVNPEWPASFLWWGEPGYEAEFVNVMSEMERHFREKGWTSTQFELFFNHKKRYKGFSWDGDEVRFDRDNQYFIAYHRLLQKAVPADSPVHIRMRVDTSWSMEHQFQELAGVITMWVAGEGELSWYPDALKALKQRGDVVWTYGGTPSVQNVSSQIALNPLHSWMSGVDGFVRWLAVDPGADPWYEFGGGGETLVYPGERFGISEPVPSIRLKLQRDCLQDLALLEECARRGSRERVQSEVAQRFNHTQRSDWSNTRPALLNRPVLEWNNTDIGDALKPYEARFDHLEPEAWQRVHEYALARAGGVQ